MTITPLDDSALLESLGHSSGPRTLGVVHLSDIIKLAMRRSQPKRFNNKHPMNMLRIETGLIFENALEEALARKFATSRPGELISDEGVYMSPDGVNADLVAGEEYKFTNMSSRHGLVDEYGMPLARFAHWFHQIMGYAKWLHVNDFVLRVLFANGDYRFHRVENEDGTVDSVPTGPQLQSFMLHFTDEELEENWNFLMLIAREEGLLP